MLHLDDVFLWGTLLGLGVLLARTFAPTAVGTQHEPLGMSYSALPLPGKPTAKRPRVELPGHRPFLDRVENEPQLSSEDVHRLRGLLFHKEEEISQRAFLVLSKVPAQFPCLQEYLKFQEADIRRVAAGQNATPEPGTQGATMRAGLQDPDEHFPRFGSGQDPVLFRLQDASRHPERFDDGQPLSEVLNAIQDPDPFRRGAAILSLGGTSVKQAPSSFRTALVDADPFVRCCGIVAIVQTPSVKLLPLLRPLIGKETCPRVLRAMLEGMHFERPGEDLWNALEKVRANLPPDLTGHCRELFPWTFTPGQTGQNP